MYTEQVLYILNALNCRQIRQAGGWIRCECPMARWTHPTGQDRSPSFGISVVKGKSHYQCFSADTVIMTREGDVPIGSLVGTEPEILTAIDKRGRWVKAPILSFGKQRIWKVVLSRNGVKKEIKTTEGHRWFVGRPGNYREVKTVDLKKDHRLRSTKLPWNGGTMKPSPFGIAHGVVFGDGSNAASKSIGSHVVLYGDKNKELLQYFPLSNYFPVKTNSVEKALWVDGLPRMFKSFPSEEESVSYLYGWLAGYFSADGCVDENGLPLMTSASRKNLEFYKKVCTRLGIMTYGIRFQWRTGYGKKPTRMYSMSISRASLQENFFLISEHRRRWLANKKVSERPGWVVVSVRKTTKIEEVFCAVVEGTHNFVLEDYIVTGNCFTCGSGDVSYLLWLIGSKSGQDLTRLKAYELEHNVPTAEQRKAQLEAEQKIPSRGSSWDETAKPMAGIMVSPGVAPTIDPVKDLPTLPESTLEPFRTIPKPVERYLLNDRRLYPETIEEWELGWHERTKRISIPIRDRKGALVGCSARAFEAWQKPKYLHSAGFRRDFYLYGEQRIQKNRTGFLCEGFFDVMYLQQQGYNAVAMFGTFLSRFQVEKIVQFFSDLVIVLDGDKAGSEATVRIRKAMDGLLSTRTVALPEGKDPDQLDEAERIDLLGEPNL